MTPDNTYCSGVGCKLKFQCSRFLETPARREYHWWTEPRYDKRRDDCPHLLHENAYAKRHRRRGV